MHTEDDLLPISALQHLLFCERQTALIHIERLWEENRFTAEGQVLHRNADAAKSETRDGVRITRGLQVHSFALGLVGICDVVNFKPPLFETAARMSLAKRIQQQLDRRNAERVGSLFPECETSSAIHDTDSMADDVDRDSGKKTPDPLHAPPRSAESPAPFADWIITPIEYKRGKPKTNDCDKVQLCAQAMCLEEMLGVSIPSGSLFYGQQQRRTGIEFDSQLRQTTIRAAARLQTLIKSRITPFATKEKKCESCSLLGLCMPPAKPTRSAAKYLERMMKD